MATSWDSRLDGETVAVSASASSPVSLRERELQGVPERIGRYRIDGQLGQGGMATVFVAHDDDLDRPVALKLVRVPASKPKLRARVLREAQAMARLQHPHVVPVFDVGLSDPFVYIAMERVAGVDLRGWLETTEHPLSEILEKFSQAAEGLAAVHDVGLVHRDFKPGNVVVGDDDRARLIDFGLAKSSDDTDALASEPSDARTQPVGTSSVDVNLTEDGSVVGTPAYMSPEQVAGRPIGPASDQFSFCASLFEACYGTRPFRGDSYRDLAKNILSGSIVETRGAGVPRWLAQVIRRGLSTDPDGRWPDMHALARALRHRGGRHGRRWAAAAVGAGVLAAWVWMDAGQQPHCDPAAGGIDSATAWARIETGVHQANVPYGSETLSRIQPHLEEHATRFAESWREACTADVAEEEVEARVGCLEQRREDFDLLVRGLAEATPKAVERATSDVHRLEDPRNCLDPSLRVSNDLDETGSSEEQSLRNHLSQASALRRAGDYEASLDTANAVLERAEALGSDALVARAAYNVGLTLKSTERREEARDAMELAYHRAVATGSDRIAANAAMQLTNLTVKASDFDEAQRWITYAKSALSRIGDPPREYSTLLDNEARMLDRMGRYDEAARVFERALVAREEAYGPNSNAMAYTLDHYGSTLSALGRYDDSFAKHSAALEILEELHGPNHPEVGRTLGNYGHILSRRGKRDEAIEAYDRSLAILRAAYGEDNSVLGALLSGRGSAYLAKGDIEHARADLKLALQIESAHTDGQDASTGIAHNNLGNVELIDRNYDEAEYHFRRAYELYASSWGTEHAYATGTFLNLARVAGAKGDHELAVQRYQEGLERLQATLPAGHITIGGAHNNLAGQLVEVGRLDEARDHFEKAKAIMTEQMLATDGRIAFPEQGLANIDLLRGDFESAIDRLTWVLDLWEQHGPPDEHQLAVARIMMAEALQGAGREPERVHSLAETATEHFAEHPDPDRLDKAKRLSR